MKCEKMLLFVMFIVPISTTFAMNHQKKRSLTLNNKMISSRPNENTPPVQYKVMTRIEYLNSQFQLLTQTRTGEIRVEALPIELQQNLIVFESHSKNKNYHEKMRQALNNFKIIIGAEQTSQLENETVTFRKYIGANLKVLEDPIREELNEEYKEKLTQLEQQHANKIQTLQNDHQIILTQAQTTTRTETINNLPFWYHYHKSVWGLAALTGTVLGSLVTYQCHTLIGFLATKIWGKSATT